MAAFAEQLVASMIVYSEKKTILRQKSRKDSNYLNFDNRFVGQSSIIRARITGCKLSVWRYGTS